MNENVTKWIQYGERGISSNTIVEVMEGLPFGTMSHSLWPDKHPHDPADLGRCVKLLCAVPEYRDRLHEMKSVSPTWSVMVDNWKELERLYFEAVASGTGKAPKLYDLMQFLIKQSGAEF